MNRTGQRPIAKFADVLDRRVENLTTAAAEANASVIKAKDQISRLNDLASGIELHPLSNVAHFANASAFRDNLIRVAQNCRDDLGVRESHHRAAQQQLMQAVHKHKVISSVLDKAREIETIHNDRAAQKTQDDMATQVWMRNLRQQR